MESDSLDHKTFVKFCDLIYDMAGIKLGPQKEALVSARVSKRIRALQMSDFKAYYDRVKNDATGAEIVELLNAISTNVTHFFREHRHFELLDQILRKWEKDGQTRYRVWCAAASTGEEPYTIAMTFKEALRDVSDVKILATDISTKVLASAKAGVYQEKHIEKIPRNMVAKYFRREKTMEGANIFRVVDELKNMITYGRLNLAKPPFPMSGPFDIIFCRNVMIYFDNDVRRKLLAEAFRLVRPGGYLMVGHAESLSGMLSEFKTVEPSVYIKAG